MATVVRQPEQSGGDRVRTLSSQRRTGFAAMGEKAISLWIHICGYLSIVFVALIFLFVFKEALPLLAKYPAKDFFFGTEWLPTSSPPHFGLVPVLLSSILVTMGAVIIAIPLGLMTAIYIAEIAPPRVREIFKPVVELMAAIPSVVLGFFGASVLGPFLHSSLHAGDSGKTMLTGAITLAFMAIPTIATISEDALAAVPREIRDGSYGLGATKWETIRRVVFPAAFSGIIAAVMLGIGRAIGETMVVLMITGNGIGKSLDALSQNFVGNLGLIFPAYVELCKPITATIAAEMGEAVQGGMHYRALFLLGVVLFFITFLINLVADAALKRARKI